MKKITDIFTKDVISYLSTNKNEITPDLLSELRKTNEGKDIALKILDIPKNDEGFYLDAFGNEVSYQRIPTLKNINRKLPIHDVHKAEIEKCNKDIFYFMNNYVKIKTKNGVNFPEIRHYQREFLECIIEDENESIVGLLPRQSGKSVTVGIYLVWLIIFEKDVNIGIAAQKASMATEFLTKVKDIFIELPIWLTPGVKTWNMKSIGFENGVRVLSDVASSGAFRGHTVSYSVTDEAAYITGRDNNTTRFKAYLDAVLPSQMALVKKKNIFISTANGMNEFYTLYKGAQKDGTKEVTEILHADKAIYGSTVEDYFNKDELNIPKEIINIEPIYEDTEISKTSGVSNASESPEISVSSEGSNDYSVSERIRSYAKYKVTYLKRVIGNNRSIAFQTDWRNVPRWKSDGTLKTPEEFREEIVSSKGEVFFQSAYGNQFVGSSYTLIDAERLKSLVPQEPIQIVDQKLKIYKKFQQGHQYVCTVDPAKDGTDGFVVNFTDITSFRLEQVATANLDIDYLLMPELLFEWCQLYGNPYLIIENNEGAGQSVSDQMVLTYEYDNIHYDKNENIKNVVKARKKYSGTRTTSRSRNQILKTMKTFFDNGNLLIHDADTINQLFTFILIDGKYQADQGSHDDCVMSLALVFVLFSNIKNITDMKEVSKQLKQDLDAVDPVNIKDLITVGQFDDGTSESKKIRTDAFGITYEGFDDINEFGSSNYDDFNEFGSSNSFYPDVSEFG